MNSTSTEKTFTPEDLLRIQDGDWFELIDGRKVERNRSFWASYVSGNIMYAVFEFVESRNLGWVVGGGVTYQCFPHDPNRVRKLAASFMRHGRLSIEDAKKHDHTHVCPDLGIEVVSPEDLAGDIQDRVADFLNAGTRLLWVVHPESKTVEVHHAVGAVLVVREQDELSGEDVLPGFRCHIAKIFESMTDGN